MGRGRTYRCYSLPRTVRILSAPCLLRGFQGLRGVPRRAMRGIPGRGTGERVRKETGEGRTGSLLCWLCGARRVRGETGNEQGAYSDVSIIPYVPHWEVTADVFFSLYSHGISHPSPHSRRELTFFSFFSRFRSFFARFSSLRRFSRFRRRLSLSSSDAAEEEEEEDALDEAERERRRSCDRSRRSGERSRRSGERDRCLLRSLSSPERLMLSSVLSLSPSLGRSRSRERSLRLGSSRSLRSSPLRRSSRSLRSSLRSGLSSRWCVSLCDIVTGDAVEDERRSRMK